jgi:hypothetical protein
MRHDPAFLEGLLSSGDPLEQLELFAHRGKGIDIHETGGWRTVPGDEDRFPILGKPLDHIRGPALQGGDEFRSHHSDALFASR